MYVLVGWNSHPVMVIVKSLRLSNCPLTSYVRLVGFKAQRRARPAKTERKMMRPFDNFCIVSKVKK